MRLADVRFDKYLGTQTAKNYSSDLRLVDDSARHRSRREDLDEQPAAVRGRDVLSTHLLRRSDDGPRGHGVASGDQHRLDDSLRGLHDRGPGMLAQFSMTLVRFLRRRDDERPPSRGCSGTRWPLLGPRCLGTSGVAACSWYSGLVVLARSGCFRRKVPAGAIEQLQMKSSAGCRWSAKDGSSRSTPWPVIPCDICRTIKRSPTKPTASRRRRRRSSGLPIRSGPRLGRL